MFLETEKYFVVWISGVDVMFVDIRYHDTYFVEIFILLAIN